MNRRRRRLILFENTSRKTRKIRKNSNSSRIHGGGDSSLFASPPPFTLALAETRLCKTLARTTHHFRSFFHRRPRPFASLHVIYVEGVIYGPREAAALQYCFRHESRKQRRSPRYHLRVNLSSTISAEVKYYR